MRTSLTLTMPGSALAAPAPGGVAARLAALAQAWRRWRIERRTVAELGRLDSATLRDIGLTRAELAAGLVREQLLRRDLAGRM